MYPTKGLKKWLLWVVVIGILSSFSTEKITWVALGDSITYLNDHQNETGNRVTKGYMTMVTEQLPHIQYINQGHNGWTAARIAEKIESLNLVKADVYSVFLGTNDWWGGRPLGTRSDYENNTGFGTLYGSFRVIINKLRSLNPAAKIILITPMQRVDFVYIANFKNNAYGSYKDKKGQMLEQFADAIKEIGKHEQLPVVDLYHDKKLGMKKLVKFKRLKDPQTGQYKNYAYPHFIEVPFNPETDEYPYPVESIAMTYDGLHPSDAGYEVISKKLVKLMKK
ncbi:SGNH/GDSL hydrolase family protein [Runella zeae]|uniref:SGNH/GDSL hydrolase family protein n=1 Tax=Runella zeae TaxID=94255 RepID=UPI00048E5AD5|nr:SGNH/GDSL hydrolase family protein [Runella zeae]